MTAKDIIPYNGKSTTISRVIEALIVAAIVAGISLYGNYKIIETKLDSLCSVVSRIDAAVNKFSEFSTQSTVDRALLRQEINELSAQLKEHRKTEKEK